MINAHTQTDTTKLLKKFLNFSWAHHKTDQTDFPKYLKCINLIHV